MVEILYGVIKGRWWCEVVRDLSFGNMCGSLLGMGGVDVGDMIHTTEACASEAKCSGCQWVVTGRGHGSCV
jgi:hypothetical protein